MSQGQVWNWYVGRCILEGATKSMREGSRARVSIGGYFLVDYGNISAGAYRQGQYTRDSDKGEDKAAELKHRV
jgi:hypothetical protein